MIMRKILVINPIANSRWNKTDGDYLQKIASHEITLNVVNIKQGPETIECSADIGYATPEILRIVNDSKKTYDGIMINCFADPAITAAREISDIPIIGPGETAIILASMLGHKFSIISPQKSIVPMFETKIANMGLTHKLASIEDLNMPVNDLESDVDETTKRIIWAINRAVEYSHAEVVVFGCTGLLFLYEEILKYINIPVIEPAAAALKMLETLISLGISHSKEGLYFYSKIIKDE